MATIISFRKGAAATQPAPATTQPAATPATTTPAAVQTVGSIPTNIKQVTPVTQPAQTETQQPAAIVPAQSSEISVEDQYGTVGVFDGEFDVSEMRMPYLSLVQKTSKVFDENPQLLGQWLYNKALVLGTELRVVFVRATKWWVEDLPFGGDVFPRRFKRLEDAKAEGFQHNQLKEQADLDLLIEVNAVDLDAEEGVADLFVGDKAYLPARYTVNSSAYGKTVPVLMSDTRGFLKGNLINGCYKMTPQSVTGKKGTYFIPQLKTDGPSTAELRAAIVDRYAAPVPAAA